MRKIEDYPKIKAILDKCYDDIQLWSQKKVSVKFSLKFLEIDTDTLRKIVCTSCGVSWETITSEKTGGMVTIARQLYCFFAIHVQQKDAGIVAHEINRNKTDAVKYAADRVQAMIDTNDELYMPYIKVVEDRINKAITV